MYWCWCWCCWLTTELVTGVVPGGDPAIYGKVDADERTRLFSLTTTGKVGMDSDAMRKGLFWLYFATRICTLWRLLLPCVSVGLMASNLFWRHEVKVNSVWCRCVVCKDIKGKKMASANMPLSDADLKIILLGDSAVGKSKLVERFLMDQ